MNGMRGKGKAALHGEISALIPWYLNGSIGDIDGQRVEEHLLECAHCREELARERLLYEGMSAEPCVEYMPAASLKRLQARLDGAEAAAEGAVSPQQAPSAAPVAGAGRRAPAWQAAMAASVALMAVAVSLLAVDRWMQSRAPASAPSYHTVTTAAPRAQGEVIRAVFAPTITLVELQAVLDEAGLRIVSGPTEAGVYSLAANSGRPASASLALLRGHANVRFAESIQPSEGSGKSP